MSWAWAWAWLLFSSPLASVAWDPRASVYGRSFHWGGMGDPLFCEEAGRWR